jgi:hypothetical protein
MQIFYAKKKKGFLSAQTGASLIVNRPLMPGFLLFPEKYPPVGRKCFAVSGNIF